MLLYTVPFVFAIGNVLILVFAGKTRNPGKIPRWWWPITVFIILYASAMYWAIMRLLMVKTSRTNEKTGDRMTLGETIGLKVQVVFRNDEDVPPKVKKSMEDTLAAQVDGSQRRVIVETSGWLKGWGKRMDRIGEFLAQYLF